MKGVLVIAALVAVSAAALPKGCPKSMSPRLLPDFKDCGAFWRCAGGVPQLKACPQGLHFSARLQGCTLPVLARCQAVSGDESKHTALKSGILDSLHNLIRWKAEPVPLEGDELSAPPELPSGKLPDEEDTFRRFPDPKAVVPELPDKADEVDGDTEDAEKSKEAGSEKEQKSADIEVESELDTKEEMEHEGQVEDGNEEEQDESERSEEKIEEEQDKVDSEEERSEEKVNETSEVGDVAENGDKNRQDSKKDVTVLKKDEEEEDEDKKKSKDLKSIKKESKKNKSEEKEKDSGSDDESEDED